jgi:hypothetical protein
VYSWIYRDRRRVEAVIPDEFQIQGTWFCVRRNLAFSLSCRSACLLVLMSRPGHQGIGFGAAFDDPWFDSAGTIADFVTGNLKQIVFAQCLADGLFRRHEPLRQQRIAGNRKAHLPRQLIVNERRLSADPPNHIMPQQSRPQFTANHRRGFAAQVIQIQRLLNREYIEFHMPAIAV